MRKIKFAALVLAALLLGGCAGKQTEEAQPTQEPEPAVPAVKEVQGTLGEQVQALMAPFADELNQAALDSPLNLTYTIPGDVLAQMAQDALETGAQAQDGRWRFTWRQTGDYSYQATVDDAADQLPSDQATPAPGDDTPMDSQLNGDYAVSGGGLFVHERAYDAAEDLSSGQAEISDSLNGSVTGYELFRFCLRDGQLYFADATLDFSADLDGVTIQSGYLAAVGVLRADGLEIMEYAISALSDLPDPASMNWSRLLATVTPLSRLSVQGDRVTAE